MIKKILIGSLLTIGMTLTFTNARQYVPCKYSEIQGNFATSGNCIKASPGETVDISNYKFVLKGGNITVYDYSNNNTYSGLYGKNRYNGLNITRNIYKDGKYTTLYKNARNYAEPQYFMLSGNITCISEDYNTCLWNSTNIANIYYNRDLTAFNGQTYDYVILPYTQQSTNAQAYGYCFHFPSQNGYLCFPIFQSQLSSSYTYTGITSNTFENTISDPFPFGGKGGGGNIIINQQCPTVKQIMQNYGYGYNTGLCYNNTTYFNGTSFEQVEKQDIFTIFDNYETYTNRISIYRNNCTNANTTQACQNAFSGEYKKYSIIANAVNSNVDEKRLRNYCNLGLNMDPNATSCVASTGALEKEPYTIEERLERVIDGLQGIPTPGQNTGDENVFNSLCDEDDPECYTKENIRDIFGSLENIYKKIIGLFKERKNVDGIIPDYILWIGFIIILFTIIFKK